MDFHYIKRKIGEDTLHIYDNDLDLAFIKTDGKMYVAGVKINLNIMFQVTEEEMERMVKLYQEIKDGR